MAKASKTPPMQPPATAAVEIVAEYPSDKFERKGKEGAKLKNVNSWKCFYSVV